MFDTNYPEEDWVEEEWGRYQVVDMGKDDPTLSMRLLEVFPGKVIPRETAENTINWSIVSGHGLLLTGEVMTAYGPGGSLKTNAGNDRSVKCEADATEPFCVYEIIELRSERSVNAKIPQEG